MHALFESWPWPNVECAGVVTMQPLYNFYLPAELVNDTAA
jgi:hypothetical protein